MKTKTWIAWLIATLLGVAISVWVFPFALVFAPESWSLTREQALDVALERFNALVDLPENPYVVVELDDSPSLEWRLLGRVDELGAEKLREHPLSGQVLQWRITVYEPGQRPGEWSFRATLSPAGELTSLRRGMPADEEVASIEPEVARQQAEDFLVRSGFDLARFEPPELRRNDRLARTDLAFRFRDREAILGPNIPFGIEVTFAGELLTGFQTWIEDPDRAEIQKRLQLVNLLGTAWILVPYLLFPIAAFSFLRRYHAGEIGVQRAIAVFGSVFLSGALLISMTARAATEGTPLGLSRALTTWAWGFQLVILWISALAATSALSWSVGESRCREGWGDKLAAFDALVRRQWANATVARASLRGLGIGTILAALLLLILAAIRPMGVWSGMSLMFDPWWENAAWPGFSLLLVTIVLGLYAELFTWLFLLPSAVRRFGTWGGGAAVALVTGVIFWPPVFVDSAGVSALFGILKAGILVAVFLRYDLLSALLASFTASVLIPALPFLLADAPFLQLQGALPLLAVATPFLLSARYLASDQEFQYRYEDVPPHVKRIAERERQRVELETARRIQSSILPDLPPRLAGVDLAHAYLPASEVGGDFYDVMDLEDGRLALAVGDVAGHGVSSGLVMSMAKSTLALQVTVNPDVDVVLQTLNRMVYKTARQRLLTTLCYAVLDTQRRELTYGSAGHLAPYRIDASGRAESLVAASYPLGVRDPSDYLVRSVQLESGDRLFLFSDGVVEACHEHSEEPFGFERLQASLERHADASPTGLRDGVLTDLEQFMGPCPRADDQTLLILQLP